MLQSLRAGEQAQRANASRDFLLGIFEDTDPGAGTGGRELLAKEILERSRSKLLAAGAHDPVLPVPELLRGIADAQVRLGDRVGALTTLDRLLGSLPASSAGAERLTTLLHAANEAVQLNDHARAKTRLRQALDDAQRQGASRAQWRQLAHVAGMVALYDPGKIDAARQSLQAYFDLADEPDSEPVGIQLVARLKLAKAQSLLGHRAAALQQLQTAAAFASRHRAELGPGSAFQPLADYRASVDGDWGQYAAVLSWLPPVIDECQRTMGAEHEDCLTLISHAIRAQLKVGQFADAARLAPRLQPQADNLQYPRRQMEAAVLMARTFAFANSPARLDPPRRHLEQMVRQDGAARFPAALRLQGLNTLAEVALLMGAPHRALVWTDEARAVQQAASLPSTAREVMKTALFEGLAWQALGQHGPAMARLAPFCDENRLAQSSQLAVLDHLFSLNCVRSLQATGEPQRASRLLDRALPLLRPALGASAPTLLRAERQMGGTGAAAAPMDASNPAAPEAPPFFS